jgi:hypothetical protein
MNKLNSGEYNQCENKNLERHCPLFVHTDAAQAIGKIKVDVNELQVDYLTVVGHKVNLCFNIILIIRICVNFLR